MHQSAIHLEKFYATPLGLAARDMTLRRLSTLWSDLANKEVLVFGYGHPYIQPYLHQTKRLIQAMPSAQGAIAYQSKRGIMTCLVDEQYLPFDDAQFDHVLVAHGLEESEALQPLLAELWRVTRPEGRVVIIAPNRGGLWASSDKSPFGSGRPFTRFQLKHLLTQVGYEPVFWSGALYAPPIKFCVKPGPLEAFERFGETVWPRFSGLVLVEAIKRLYANPDGLKSHRITRPAMGGPIPLGSG